MAVRELERQQHQAQSLKEKIKKLEENLEFLNSIERLTQNGDLRNVLKIIAQDVEEKRQSIGDLTADLLCGDDPDEKEKGKVKILKRMQTEVSSTDQFLGVFQGVDKKIEENKTMLEQSRAELIEVGG